jgi:hypothetical protein
MRGHDRAGLGRGWGPFTGRQLTTIVCVAIVAMVLLPTAAIAVGGSFTSKSNQTPGLHGVNTGSNGIGVAGRGKRYGVYSNGPLGVASGKSLSCTACVTPKDLARGAKNAQPLAPNESESGVFNVADIYPATTPGMLETSLSFARPVIGTLHYEVTLIGSRAGTENCLGPGSASRGYVCVYDTANQDVSAGSGFTIDWNGAGIQWTEIGGGSASARGTFTVTAP